MKNQAYRMTLLYDFYGDLLTERQKEFYDLYYNEDLSLAEIAENYGITRQGVRDVIVRGEAYLTEIEEKTGIIRRFLKMQEYIDQMQQAVDKLIALNEAKFQDDTMEELCLQLKDLADKLKKE